MSSKPIAITWSLSTISGYGIYGLQLALQFFRRGGEKFINTNEPGAVVLPTLTHMRLAPALDLAHKLSDILKKNPNETLDFDHAVLYAVGNNCAGFEGQDRVRGSLKIGCAAIEHAAFSNDAKEYAKNYDMMIAISKWNEDFLKTITDRPVHLCHQGIDTTLFMPGPKTGLWKNHFVIFSGGKFEFRKGQDIVVEAFKRFHSKHPEAILITCWQNLLPQNLEPFEMAGNIKTLPQMHPGHGLQISSWLLEQGLPIGSFVDLPYTPNMIMPSVLHECDAAIFPNRCEGGTNLVAMEAMACGVPTYVSNNTGQKDLADMLGCPAFTNQKAVQAPNTYDSVEGWGETAVDEVVEALETMYTKQKDAREKAHKIAEKIKAWDWGPQNEKLLKLACDY